MNSCIVEINRLVSALKKVYAGAGTCRVAREPGAGRSCSAFRQGTRQTLPVALFDSTESLSISRHFD